MIKLLLFSFFLLATTIVIRPGFAGQPCPTPLANASPRVEGLITATNTITGVDNAKGNCIVDSSAEIKVGAAKILRAKSYNELKTTFYTNSKAASGIRKPENNLNGSFPPAVFAGNGLYHYKINPGIYDGNVTIDPELPGSLAGTGTQVIFIDGNLTINSDIKYHQIDSDGGLVFVVGGDINIDAINVSEIDAVLVSFKKICTAYTGSSACPQALNSPPLTIYGSLVSLACSDRTDTVNCDPNTNYLQLQRSLQKNSAPAETIKAQAKYLTLLTVNDLMDEDLIIPNEN